MRKNDVCLVAALALTHLAGAAPEAGITGELKTWHKVTLTVTGPPARETDSAPNPFLDYRMSVAFTHASGQPSYQVPGYFAADGDAAESSAEAGDRWRAHLAPDKPGRWSYRISFVAGPHVAVDTAEPGTAVAGCDGLEGTFEIEPTDKGGRDFRGQGRLEYVGHRYLRFAGSGRYFLKAGADSPENLLGYRDFDGTYSAKQAGITRDNEAATTPLKTWAPHVRDWREGDPSWRGGRGKGLIGALNYLAGTGCNAISFLTYNAGGDGDDVWPYIAREDKLHLDCSKLEQWQIVFDHAQALGLHLHFKLQETENDDNRFPEGAVATPVALDGGELGLERRLYLRELIARFGYALALNWNLGEENTQTPAQQRAMAHYIRATDPYPHAIVIHSFPNWQDRVYPPLLGDQSALTGASVQTGWMAAHKDVLHWINESARSGRPWVVANDEQNPHYTGVPPEPGWEGFDGTARPERHSPPYTIDDIRKATLWGTLMAGGGGVEYYFGYTLPQNDLGCQDWRSRARSWDWCRIALQFFEEHGIPFWEMHNADELVGNAAHDNSRYCLAAPGRIYVVYLPQGGEAALDTGVPGRARYSVRWFDPRRGGALREGQVRELTGTGIMSLGEPPTEPAEDWVVVVRAEGAPEER